MYTKFKLALVRVYRACLLFKLYSAPVKLGLSAAFRNIK